MSKKNENKKVETRKETVKVAAGRENKKKIVVSPDKSFYFWSDNHFLGQRASSLEEFSSILETVETNSIRYHLTRGDFQNWLVNELGENDLAKSLSKIDANKEETLRKEVLAAVKAAV